VISRIVCAAAVSVHQRHVNVGMPRRDGRQGNRAVHSDGSVRSSTMDRSAAQRSAAQPFRFGVSVWGFACDGKRFRAIGRLLLPDREITS
jgi:hypothetical protein